MRVRWEENLSGSAELAERREEKRIRDEAEVEDRMLIKYTD